MEKEDLIGILMNIMRVLTQEGKSMEEAGFLKRMLAIRVNFRMVR